MIHSIIVARLIRPFGFVLQYDVVCALVFPRGILEPLASIAPTERRMGSFIDTARRRSTSIATAGNVIGVQAGRVAATVKFADRGTKFEQNARVEEYDDQRGNGELKN